MEDELLQLDNISIVQAGYPPDEIAIEVKPDVLRKYNLSISDITTAIRAYSSNISAGQLRTQSGIIAVRVENQYYQGDEFAKIPVKIGTGGSQVLLGDVAEIKDAFTEGDMYFKYSGKNAIYMTVRATKTQSIIPVAQSIKDYVELKNEQLPDGVSLEVMVDFTYYLDARLDMMLKNLLQGAILVAIMLSLFLRFRLAFWVMVGLPICFLGAVMLMPLFGVSINLMSLFAFIMVLGIVVDDAIIVGENIFRHQEEHGEGLRGSIEGAQEIAKPVIFAVLTTVAAFTPLLFVPGMMGKMFRLIPLVVKDMTSTMTRTSLS
mgnify:CR=1 FL=1